MLYDVHGTDLATGQPRTLTLDAEGAGEAMAQAKREGLKPKTVNVSTKSAEAPSLLKRPSRPPLASRDRALLLVACLRILAVLAAVVAVGGPFLALALLSAVPAAAATAAVGYFLSGASACVLFLAVAEALLLLLDLRDY